MLVACPLAAVGPPYSSASHAAQASLEAMALRQRLSEDRLRAEAQEAEQSEAFAPWLRSQGTQREANYRICIL